MYGNIQGMEHVLSSGGDFILRYRTKGFNVYDEKGDKINLIEQFKVLNSMESMSVKCFYYSEGKKRPVRLVAMRKDDESIKAAQRKMTKKMNKQRGKVPSKEALAFNQYIVLATSLDYSDERILELYRARWQIEQVFLRLKGLYSFGDVPSKNPDSVKAWFYGKLFLAVLGETILKRECFSPEEQNIMRTLGIVKSVEGS
jgi:transposase